jgi:hypothetical protein
MAIAAVIGWHRARYDSGVTNPWAPKSAYDEVDEPLVVRARRWHGALYALAFLLGLGVGYLVFMVMDDGTLIARVTWLYGDYEPTASDRLLACGVLMVVLGGIFGETANALWLVMCRDRLGLSASQAAQALRAPSIPSFVLERVYRHLYEKRTEERAP